MNRWALRVFFFLVPTFTKPPSISHWARWSALWAFGRLRSWKCRGFHTFIPAHGLVSMFVCRMLHLLCHGGTLTAAAHWRCWARPCHRGRWRITRWLTDWALLRDCLLHFTVFSKIRVSSRTTKHLALYFPTSGFCLISPGFLVSTKLRS